MSDLRDKLGRFFAGEGAKATTVQGPRGAQIGAASASRIDPRQLERAVARHAQTPLAGATIAATPLEAIGDWRPVETRRGIAWELEERVALGTTAGDARVSEVLAARTERLRDLMGDARLEGFAFDRATYLDIEATGLSHGAGTVACLIGLGRFEADPGGACFVMRQLLVRDPAQEGAALARFVALMHAALDSSPYIVSFNGKSYDLSVLQSRLVMFGFGDPSEVALKLKPHLDLLHLGRALWKGVLDDCRLPTLERAVLKLARIDDVPGSAVPGLFFRFVRTRDARGFEPVLRHNRQDVLSLALLGGRLATLAHGDPIALAAAPEAVVDNLRRLWRRRKMAGGDELCTKRLDRSRPTDV